MFGNIIQNVIKSFIRYYFINKNLLLNVFLYDTFLKFYIKYTLYSLKYTEINFIKYYILTLKRILEPNNPIYIYISNSKLTDTGIKYFYKIKKRKKLFF